MEYAVRRERVVGFLDKHRREADDPVFARALQRLTSIAVWVLDQNRYKPHVGAAELREQVLHEVKSYLQKMYVDGFGDPALHDAVVRATELLEEVFDQLVAEEAASAGEGAARGAAQAGAEG